MIRLLPILLLAGCHVLLPLSHRELGGGPDAAVADRGTADRAAVDLRIDTHQGPADLPDSDWPPIDLPGTDSSFPIGDAGPDLAVAALCTFTANWGCISVTNQCIYRCPKPLAAQPSYEIRCQTNNQCKCIQTGLPEVPCGSVTFDKTDPCKACVTARLSGCCAP